IAGEIAEETRYALACAVSQPAHALPPYARIKDARKLTPGDRAVLREIAAVREAAAERLDLPPGRVIPNDALVRIARARPRTPPELSKQFRMSGPAASIVGDLLAAIA